VRVTESKERVSISSDIDFGGGKDGRRILKRGEKESKLQGRDKGPRRSSLSSGKRKCWGKGKSAADAPTSRDIISKLFPEKNPETQGTQI